MQPGLSSVGSWGRATAVYCSAAAVQVWTWVACTALSCFRWVAGLSKPTTLLTTARLSTPPSSSECMTAEPDINRSLEFIGRTRRVLQRLRAGWSTEQHTERVPQRDRQTCTYRVQFDRSVTWRNSTRPIQSDNGGCQAVKSILVMSSTTMNMWLPCINRSCHAESAQQLFRMHWWHDECVATVILLPHKVRSDTCNGRDSQGVPYPSEILANIGMPEEQHVMT